MRFITMPCALILASLAMVNPVQSGEIPAFIQKTYPEGGVEAAWQAYRSVFGQPEGALDAGSKELIALAVSAQVPCEYCVYYHTKAARAQGASQAQIHEALAAAALVRKWSTMLNGSRYDMAQWRAEVDAMFPAGD